MVEHWWKFAGKYDGKKQKNMSETSNWISKINWDSNWCFFKLKSRVFTHLQTGMLTQTPMGFFRNHWVPVPWCVLPQRHDAWQAGTTPFTSSLHLFLLHLTSSDFNADKKNALLSGWVGVLVLAAGRRHDRSTIRQVQKTLRKCQTAPKGPAPGLSGEAICHTDAKDGSEDGFVFSSCSHVHFS